MKFLSNGCDAVLITNPTNIRYLTGFVGVAPSEREAFVLITATEAFLFTNSLYREQAKQLSNNQIIQLSNIPIKTIEISREKPIAKALLSVIPGLTRNPVTKRKNGSRIGVRDDTFRLGFEENNLTVAELRKLEKFLMSITLVPTKDRIEKLRMIKRGDEIENIRRAAKLTDECFNYITNLIKPGVTESQIAWEIEKFFRERGADIAFSPIVAFGKNTSQPHYNTIAPSSGSDLKKPQGPTLSKPDVVLLDFGARVNGYCSDMTRVVFIGPPKANWVKAYNSVLAANNKALELLKNGECSGAKLDRFAKGSIKKARFPAYQHSLGHNVGLDIHEMPRLTIKKDAQFKPGMVFTIEPAIYKEGEFGIRIEDLVLIKKNDIEILSQSPKDITILAN